MWKAMLFFQNYLDTSYVCLFSFQASANKRQQSATDFPVIAYCTKKINNAFGYLFM